MNVISSLCKVFINFATLKKFTIPPIAILIISILFLFNIEFISIVNTEYDVSQVRTLVLSLMPMAFILLKIPKSSSFHDVFSFVFTIFAIATWSSVIYKLDIF